MLILEGFQAGLSWITILKKREAFRKAFDGFDPAAVAGGGPGKLGSLMNDPHGSSLAGIPPAAGLVVVDNTHRLEECINDRAADKLHPPALQVGRNAVGQFSGSPD